MSASIDFFDELVRAEISLYNAVDARMKAEHGVTVGTIEILSLIAQAEHARVDDIVRALDLRVGTASKIIDRYAAAGWVERIPNPDDRRSSWIVLMDAGAKVLAEGTPTFEASVTDLVSGLSSGELRTLRALLVKLAASVDARRPA
ncbi:multiple antibiotic resistance transcriptional regulator MarR [Gryllotalpicola kribbensis]|uniref:Multiple antibiotic resistance transcriptional regulator MarR n=1 Tax=Gryllotalpicola kribbensis TaxID=993084 RepID=A0ABP8AU52_9MICO